MYGCSVVESIVRRLRIRQDPLSCGGEWSAGRCEARVSDLVEAGTVAFSMWISTLRGLGKIECIGLPSVSIVHRLAASPLVCRIQRLEMYSAMYRRLRHSSVNYKVIPTAGL